MKKIKTREVDHSQWSNYLKVAKEYLAGAKDHHKSRRYIGCCGDAVHCVIAANDALTIRFLGKKSVSSNHSDASTLLRQTSPDDKDILHQMARFQRIIGLKNVAEYDGGKVDEKDADMSLKDAQRFLEFVEKKINR